MKPPGNSSRRVKSVDNVFEIIELVRKLDGAGVTELSNRLEMSKSSVHNYLTTLHSNEYLVKRDNKYHLGLRFYDHGMFVKNQITITEVADPALSELAENTEALALLQVEEHGRVVYLCRKNGDPTVSYGRSGRRTHMHCLAGGKAILAHLPEERIDEIIERHGLPHYTERTITDGETLREELREIRNTGIAYNDEESKRGLRAVGTPILRNDVAVGALSVSGPAHRMPDERFRVEIPESLRAAANEVELQLTYDAERMIT